MLITPSWLTRESQSIFSHSEPGSSVYTCHHFTLFFTRRERHFPVKRRTARLFRLAGRCRLAAGQLRVRVSKSFHFSRLRKL